MVELNSERALILLAVVALSFVALAAFVVARRSRTRRSSLRQRFGREYERAVEEYGGVEEAERALLERERRVHHLKLRALRDSARKQFAHDWRAVQAHFVDDPSGAVREASSLIDAVLRARGYPMEDFDQRVADLSVEHGNVVQHYRAARVLAEANREGRANTEELRQAFVHYRALFADLLDEPELPGRELQGVRV